MCNSLHLYSYTLLELVLVLVLVLQPLLALRVLRVLHPFSAASLSSLSPNAGSFEVLASGNGAEALYCAAERHQYSEA